MGLANIETELLDLNFELSKIESELKKVKEGKNTGICVMIISIFFLWPLLIVGGVMYSNNSNKEKELLSKKARIEHEIYKLDIKKRELLMEQ